jgi:diguanylate cyclase (GGDEF)-like protein/PAS domain S-box-containing protein
MALGSQASCSPAGAEVLGELQTAQRRALVITCLGLAATAALLTVSSSSSDGIAAPSHLAGEATVAGLSLLVAGVVHLAGRQWSASWSCAGCFVVAVLASGAIFFQGRMDPTYFMAVIWPVPYAFAFFSWSGVMTQMAWLASSSSLAALAAPVLDGKQALLKPDACRLGIAYGVVLLLGAAVRTLSGPLRSPDWRFRQGFEESPVPMALVGLDTRWLAVNKAFADLLGADPEDLVGKPVAQLVEPQDAWSVGLPTGRLLAGEHQVSFERRFRRRDGAILHTKVTATAIRSGGKLVCVYAVAENLTRERQATQQLAHSSTHDALTGAYNREFFSNALDAALSQARYTNGTVIVALLDLDHLRVLNDSLGHAAGDAVLRAIVPRLQNALHSSDVLARWGGDEFVVLCDHEGTCPETLGHTVLSVCEDPFAIDGQTYQLTLCVGIAVSASGAESSGALLRNADAALYRAKARGRSQLEIFDESMRQSAIKRLELEHDLREALRSGSLSVVYQPIVDIASGRVASLEVLSRWPHPTYGQIRPSEFIHLAEATGMIDDLGSWVLGRVTREVARWRAAGILGDGLRVAINVSTFQLTSMDFTRRVEAELEASGLDGSTLAVEITETAIMDESPAIMESIAALRRMGLTIVLDDFGTGYSSLSYLQRLAVDGLKIDASFVANLGKSHHAEVICEAVVKLGDALGVEVTAEGVETEAQLRQLAEMGCEKAQGFYFYRPAAAHVARRILFAQAERSREQASSAPSG